MDCFVPCFEHVYREIARSIMKVQYNAHLTLMRWCTLINTLCILLRNVAGYVTPSFNSSYTLFRRIRLSFPAFTGRWWFINLLFELQQPVTCTVINESYMIIIKVLRRCFLRGLSDRLIIPSCDTGIVQLANVDEFQFTTPMLWIHFKYI